MSEVSVMVEAKKEYTKELISILTIPIYQGIRSIYDDAVKLMNQSPQQPKNYPRMFQQLLKDVKVWNQEIIEMESNRIVRESDCGWLGSLIKSVVVSHVKVLCSVRMSKNIRNIKLNVPNTCKFIHKCYVESAKGFYSNPFLFSAKNHVDIHRNMQTSLSIIRSAISDAIRMVIPFQQIINECIENPLDDEEDDDDDEYDDNDDDVDDNNDDNDDKDDDYDDVDDDVEDNDIPPPPPPSPPLPLEDDENKQQIAENSLDNFDEPTNEGNDKAQPQGVHSADNNVEQRSEVKSIRMDTGSKTYETPKREVIHRKSIKPENVGNVDLSSYSSSNNEDDE